MPYWWNDEIEDKRRECIRKRRLLTRLAANRQAAEERRNNARDSYASAKKELNRLIAVLKKICWKELFPTVIDCWDYVPMGKDVVPFTEGELKCALKNMKRGKASGPDGVPTEAVTVAADVCDHNLEIMNVCARYPGSDSGYALRSWMLTPITPEPAPHTPEFRYNAAHKTIRSTVERCNEVLKMRFRCLFKHRVLHYDQRQLAR
nr:unnamed protein product [Callosobruchus analis]